MRARFRYRRRPTFGPFALNITEKGLRSWSINLWFVTWNFTHRRGTINLFGIGPRIEFGPGPKR
jgi:hypothetical protein